MGCHCKRCVGYLELIPLSYGVYSILLLKTMLNMKYIMMDIVFLCIDAEFTPDSAGYHSVMLKC